MRFRPRIGDYVFISRGMTIATMTAITGFRPHIGDYFFIDKKNAYDTEVANSAFPSPY